MSTDESAKVIRLPVTGDWVRANLILGVTAHSCAEGLAMVTVWVGEDQIFTCIEVGTIERAEEVRDQIAVLSGLAEGADASGYDPEDPGRGGGWSEDEEEGGEGDDDAGPKGPQASTYSPTKREMRRMLAYWDTRGETKH